MKKYIFPILSIVLIIIIATREFKIIQLNEERSLLSDSVQYFKKSLDTCNSNLFFNFHQIECTPIFDRFVKSGDSLNLKVILAASNIVSEEYSRREAFITLGKGLNENFDLLNIYDTIYAKDWICNAKIKTIGLGEDSLFGAYNMPWKDNTYHSFGFSIKYFKLDNATYNTLIKAAK
jgi:hypothetical protein